MSFSTLSISNKPIENKTNREAKPSCGEEKIKAIVPYKTVPIKEVTFPEKE